MDIEKLAERLGQEAYGSDIEDLLLDAATALSTLQAENQALRNAANGFKAENEHLRADLRRLQTERDALWAANQHLLAERDADREED